MKRSIFSIVAFRTTALQMAFSLVILALFATLYVHRLIGQSRQELRASAESAAAIVRSNYIAGDLLILRRNLSDLKKTNQWISARLVDAEGVELWGAKDVPLIPPQVTSKILSSLHVQNIEATAQKIVQRYEQAILFSKGGQKIGVLIVEYDLTPETEQFLYVGALIAGAMFLLILSFAAVNFVTLKAALRPVLNLKAELSREAQRIGLNLHDRESANEIQIVPVWFRQVALSWREERDKAVESSRMEAMGKLAKQIAHDIRSPLSALNIALRNLGGEACEKRQLASRAIERINNIASDLLVTAKKGDVKAPVKVEVVLSELLENLVAEKRLEYQDDSRVCLEFTDGPEGLSTSVDAHVLSRILSNVINNSLESYDADAHVCLVQVALKPGDLHHAIEVRDFGRGIPNDVLRKFGKQEISLGKKGRTSGFGLGMYDAFRAIRDRGGDIQISSCLGVGTKVSIHIPKLDSVGVAERSPTPLQLLT